MSSAASPSSHSRAEPDPDSGPRIFATQAELEAAKINEASVPLTLIAILAQSLGELSYQGMKLAYDEYLKAAGNPTDPTERMLLEELFMAHHRLMQLHGEAALTNSLEGQKVLNTLAVRLQGEIRRLALALRHYRSPVSGRSFSVVHQQNVSSGSQEIHYDKDLAAEEQKNSLSRRSELEGNQQTEIQHGVNRLKQYQDEEPQEGGSRAEQRPQAPTVDA